RPLAFGGRVFHTIPDLHRRIPGYYLGDSLPDGLSQIEALLSGPAPQILRDEKSVDFSGAIAQFWAHKPQIESQVLEAMFAKRDENIFPEYIRNANDFLAEDIIAGLKLGSMDLLDSDIVWLKGLLRNRGIPDELILNYLLAYHEAAKSHLGKGGQPIIDWLAENIEG
ncbi:MAG: hypothetical protein MUO76_09230, partial [Anaerolineaceae bacterium]|nr:hypothetical protein [Anaerolineaceae bacterium]